MGDLIQEISKLSIAERIQLVQAILDTIAADNASEKDFVLSKSQKKEVKLGLLRHTTIHQPIQTIQILHQNL